MAMGNVSLMFAAYVTEYAIRMDFHRQSQALHESTHTQELLKMLLPERVTAKIKAASKTGYKCQRCGRENADGNLTCKKCKLPRPPVVVRLSDTHNTMIVRYDVRCVSVCVCISACMHAACGYVDCRGFSERFNTVLGYLRFHEYVHASLIRCTHPLTD